MGQQLLSSFKLGPVELKNRIVFNAPGSGYGGMDENANHPTMDLAAYWSAIAKKRNCASSCARSIWRAA